MNASDDAAGLAIGTQLQAGAAVLAQDRIDVAQGQSLMQTADAGLAEISAVLARMMALAASAASGQVTNTQRVQDIETEYQQLSQQINVIAASSEYAGNSLLSFPTVTATGAFSWESSSVLDGFYQAQVLRDSQGPQGAGYAVPGDGLVDDTGQVAKYTSGIDGLPTGTSGTFDATPLENGDKLPFGPAAFVVGTNGSSTISMAIGAENTVTLGFERDTVSYVDAPVTTVAVDVTVELPTPHTVTVNESAATWLANNPGQNLPGTVTTAVTTSVSNVDSVSAALVAMATVGSAINTVAEQRAKVGAYEAQFQFADAEIASSNQATTAAASVILDCDAAAEKSRLSADMVKTQAAVAALSQASQLPRALLKLINT